MNTSTTTISAAWTVTWVSGPDAGESVVIGPGRHYVGRSRTAAIRCDDAALALHAAVIEVHPDGPASLVRLAAGPDRAERAGSVTKLSSGQRVRVGASGIELRAGLAPPAPAPAFRPPLVVPRPSSVPSPFGGRAGHALAGIAVAAVTGAIIGQPALILCGMAGGLVGLATWAVQRAGVAMTRAGARRDQEEAIDRFTAEVAAHCEHAAQLARLTAPTLVRALAALAGGPAKARGRQAPLRAAVGEGSLDRPPSLRAVDRDCPAEVWAAVEHLTANRAAPAVVDLRPGAVLTVVGGATARAVVRSVIVQLVAFHAASWQVMAIGDGTADWIPTGNQAGGPADVIVLDGVAQSGPAVATALQRARHEHAGAAVVVVVDLEPAVPIASTSVLIVGTAGQARWIADTSGSWLADTVDIAGLSVRSTERALQHLTQSV